jgi:hypothetical protein
MALQENKASLAQFICTNLEKDGANYFKFKDGNELIVSGGFEQIEKAWSDV